MKKLFVIQNFDKIAEEESKNLLTNKNKIDKENISLELDLQQSHSESTNLAQTPKTECPKDSRKYSLFSLSTDNSLSSNTSNNSDLEGKAKEQTYFLGKKTKFHFNIIKESPQKIKQNNLRTKKTENKLNLEKNGNNESLNIEEYQSKEESNKKKEGRWSFEEKSKFIEALIINGKDWRNIQKYIGSRTCAQTRSHAQKLLLKLRAIENSEFNFKKESIKNLFDIIEEIKNKEGIKNVSDDINKKNILEKMLSLIDGNFNESIGTKKFTSNIDDKKITKFENLNSNLKTKIPNINSKKVEININNIKHIDNQNDNGTKDIQNKKLDLSENKNLKTENLNNINSKEINDLNEPSNQKLVFDDGFAYYVDSNSIYEMNNFSYYIKNYECDRNKKKSKLINRYFFF